MLNLNQEAEQREPWDGAPPPQYRDTQDPLEKFKIHIAGFGFFEDVIPDGKLYRVKVGNSRDKAGWVVFNPGEICGAAFGDWSTGVNEKWCSKDVWTLTYKERTDYNTKQKQNSEARKAQEKINHAKAKKLANELWEASEPLAPGGHPYFVKKGLEMAHDLRVGKNEWGQPGRLIIPSRDEFGQIHSLQFIEENGEKRFQTLGRRQGLFFEFPGAHRSEEIYIAEGVATGATIREKTGATVFCSFTANQLPGVARVIRSLYPNHKITIAADNDQFTPGNPGIDYGKEAARAIDVPMAYPKFTYEQIATWRHLNGNPDKGPTDFNDLAVFDVAAVVIQLGDADKKRMLSPLTLTSMAMKNLKKRPPDREYILTLDGKPFMPGYVVGVLSATGGTGKTYFLMKMAYTMASGGSFGPIKATRKLKVVMICAEDDQDEVNRRLWDISGGVFPDTLYATSIYGEAGPLMRLDGNTPTRAETFYWLETFLRQNQGQIDVLIMDPKSRLYGLDENNNDHATEWIRCLEFLGKEYCVTILFATHTAKEAGKSISTATNRGAQAIIDGCRWGVVMAEIDQETAGKYGITNPRDYIVLDVQKSNYAARQSHYLYFKRGLNGVLEYVPLADIKNGGMVETFVYFLGAYDWTPTPRDLEKHGNVSKIVKDMESNFPGFKKGDLPELAEYCVEKGALEKMEVMGGNYVKTFNYRVPKNNA